MKRPWIAFVLSFLIPGLGLAVVGRRWAALGNLAVAAILPMACLWLWPQQAADFLHYVMLAIAAGSGGLAHAVASQRNGQTSL